MGGQPFLGCTPWQLSDAKSLITMPCNCGLCFLGRMRCYVAEESVKLNALHGKYVSEMSSEQK